MIMGKDVVWTDSGLLESFMADVFRALGVPEEDAAICANVLITSDLRGIDSHGVGRMWPIYYERIRNNIQEPVTRFEVVREGAATAVVDGNNGMGQVIGKRSMQMAIDKASRYGMGMVAAKNSTHYGIAGFYLLMAAKQGMIGITGTNARPSIAPTFGVENMLGTNPLTFGMPTDEPFDFILDCATSTAQRGKVEVYEREGKSLPPGWVIGHDGTTQTDAHQVLEDLVAGTAALTPLGGIGEDGAGYKGYGYATVVETLSAALQAGPFLKGLTGFDEHGNRQPFRLGHFFIAINVEAFIDLESFKKTTGDILRQLRASKKAPGQDRIYTAGEKEYLAWQHRKVKGIPLNNVVQAQILEMRDEMGLTQYTFDFE
jgi:L-2-hydroxycarboxylate dehydrogenase (NAD+)